MTLPASLEAKRVELVWEVKLADYIKIHLGREFRVQQNQMFGQDTIHTFEVWLDPDATAKVQAWLDSPPCMFPGRLGQPEPAGDHWGATPGTTLGESVDIFSGDILNELCNRGLLPEGDLTIHIWW